MSKNYTQLNLVQRYQIEALLKTDLKKSQIAKQIGVHPSTVGRELKRNIALRGKTAGDYVASNAQRKTDIRHQQKPKQVLFTVEMKHHAIKQLLIDKWSPELISVKGKQSVNVLLVMNGYIIGYGNLSMETKEQIDLIKSCTNISNTVREGVSEEIVKIEEALYRTECRLKSALKSLKKGNGWEIWKLI